MTHQYQFVKREFNDGWVIAINQRQYQVVPSDKKFTSPSDIKGL